MSIFLIDKIKPKNGGVFPLVDDIDMVGGFRAVPDTTTRDAIPTDHRKSGMLVWTDATSALWQLQGGTSNSNWVSVSFGGGGGGGGGGSVDLTQISTDVAWVASVVASLRQQDVADPSSLATDLNFRSQAPNAGGGVLTGRPGNITFTVPSSVGGADDGSAYFFIGASSPFRIDRHQVVVNQAIEFGAGNGSGPVLLHGPTLPGSGTEGSLFLMESGAQAAGVYSYHNGAWGALASSTGFVYGDLTGRMPNPNLGFILGQRFNTYAGPKSGQVLTVSQSGGVTRLLWDPTKYNSSAEGPAVWSLNSRNGSLTRWDENTNAYQTTAFGGQSYGFTDMCFGTPVLGGPIDPNGTGHPPTIWIVNQYGDGKDFTAPILIKVDTTPFTTDSSFGLQGITGQVAVFKLNHFGFYPTGPQYSLGFLTVTYDTDNNFVWVANQVSSDILRVDPNTGATTVVTMPTGYTGLGEIFYGAGYIWVGSARTGEDKIFRVNPVTFETVAIHTPNYGSPGSFFIDGNSKLWALQDRYAGSSYILRIDPATATIELNFNTGVYSLVGLLGGNPDSGNGLYLLSGNYSYFSTFFDTSTDPPTVDPYGSVPLVGSNGYPVALTQGNRAFAFSRVANGVWVADLNTDSIGLAQAENTFSPERIWTGGTLEFGEVTTIRGASAPPSPQVQDVGKAIVVTAEGYYSLGSPKFHVTPLNDSTYTVQPTDDVVAVVYPAACTVTLPTLTTYGYRVTVKECGGNAITLTVLPSPGTTIEGLSSKVTTTAYAGHTYIFATSSTWVLLS